MTEQQDRRLELRQAAHAALAALSHEEREGLLIKCWMSHDARWFMAVAASCGMEVASRLNQTAAREQGKVEARRIARALGLPPVTTLDEYLAVQEMIIGLVGPELLDYQVIPTGEGTCQIHIQRCFAHENVTRAGVAEQYECGIFARVMGWLDGLGVDYEMTPALGKCAKAQGRECVYTLALRTRAA